MYLIISRFSTTEAGVIGCSDSLVPMSLKELFVEVGKGLQNGASPHLS